MQGTQVRSLEQGMATHSSVLARRLPWTEEGTESSSQCSEDSVGGHQGELCAGEYVPCKGTKPGSLWSQPAVLPALRSGDHVPRHLVSSCSEAGLQRTPPSRTKLPGHTVQSAGRRGAARLRGGAAWALPSAAGVVLLTQREERRSCVWKEPRI